MATTSMVDRTYPTLFGSKIVTSQAFVDAKFTLCVPWIETKTTLSMFNWQSVNLAMFNKSFQNYFCPIITNFQYHEISIESVQKYETICSWKIYGLQSVKMAWKKLIIKNYIYNFYIKDVFVFTYDVLMWSA
jgi:hypothetical protein